MVDFLIALSITLQYEGGYLQHRVKGDRGGLTYAGISQTAHPTWEGWGLLKEGKEADAKKLVANFYKVHYWDKIGGDRIESQAVANLLFDTAVNMGVRTASKMAQLVIDVQADGVVGNVTLANLNKFTLGERGQRLFCSELTLAKITRVKIFVQKDRKQGKFLHGWLNRYLNICEVIFKDSKGVLERV